MEFDRLLEIVGDEPLFETALLLAGDIDPDNIRRQLTRWTRAGRLYQLRRGLYTLAPPYQKRKPHPFTIANRMVRASYVSCQSALAYHDLIPEYSPTVTSITTARPARWDTPLGSFVFRHIKTEHFRGYELMDLGGDNRAFLACLEKALLDLIYLTPRADSESYLRSLRLQNLERLDLNTLKRLTKHFDRPKLYRASSRIQLLAHEEAEEYGPT
jgi:predicted transcriptional regulator of viral defense system